MQSSGWMQSGSMDVWGGRAGAAALALVATLALPASAALAQAGTPEPVVVETAAGGMAAPAEAATDAGRTVSTAPNPELLPSAVPVSDNAIHLSLDDAVTTALRRNLGLLVERYERQQFSLRIDEALGIYDLGLDGNALSSSETSATTSRLSGADVQTTKVRYGRFSVGQLTPWGGTGSATLDLTRVESNNTFLLLNPSFTSNFDLGITQPLLRNFGKVVTERGIRIAQLNSDISRETFEAQVASTLQQVENAYWNVVQGRKEVEVAEESLRLAEDLHRMNKVRVDVGTLAPLELVQSEVGIATRQEDIILAQAAEQNAEDTLRQLLHLEEGELWDLPIIPTTPPETAPVEIDLAEAMATAMKERPELRSQDRTLDLLALDVAFEKNQALPRLDLLATYGYNGVGGTVIERDPVTGAVVSTSPGGATDALHQVRDRDFEGWRLELVFGYALQNRTARARKAIAEVNLDQGETQRDQLQESIRTEVRRAVRAVRTAAQEIQSAGASTRLAEKNLDAERKRYENGLSTSFQVLQIQEDLTAARSRQVAAIAGYRRALAEYHRATGRLLDAEGVELDDPLHVEHLDRFGCRVGTPAAK